MQNWESMPQANYEHNWYTNMFTAVKREPSTQSYNVEHHHVGISKTSTMDASYSPTSPHKQSETGLEGPHSFYENHIFNGLNNPNHPLGFNPLTPPGYPNAILPQINFNQDFQESTVPATTSNSTSNTQHVSGKPTPPEVTQSLTPSHTPPMDITPPKSPKSLPATPEKDQEMSSNSNDSGEDTRFFESDNDDEAISKPKFNSHGKVKKFKCKQCGYIAITKVDFWTHAREHIKPEKLLECHFCPFVTELKHHLEYHIRKHKNLKPFQCDQCSYSCVNKSMLNSHLKSHSKVYQYRCSDCDYATKYCHSFKLHLRKYSHKPGMVLNEDGTPNPLIIIDVYGTRRGPKMKGSRDGTSSSRSAKHESRNFAKQSAIPKSETTAQPRVPSMLNNQSTNMMSNLLPNTIANMLQQSRNLPFFPYLNLNLQMLAVQQQAVLAQLSPNMQTDAPATNDEHQFDDRTSRYDSDAEDSLDTNSNCPNAMDLTQSSPIKSAIKIENNNNNHHNQAPATDLLTDASATSITTTPILSGSKTNRRKGRAFKLDSTGGDDHDGEGDVTRTQPEIPNVVEETVKPNAEEDNHGKSTTGEAMKSSTLPPRETNPNNDDTGSRLNPKDTYECRSCGIYFRDAVLHTIHMGYHSCDDEFKCNMCGERCGDRLTFFVHIARFPHS